MLENYSKKESCSEGYWDYGLKNKKNFDEEMDIFLNILIQQGFVLECNHPYAYAMQYEQAFEDVSGWIEQHGYVGELYSLGTYDVVAVYGLYDENRISYDDMMAELSKEAKRQVQNE